MKEAGFNRDAIVKVTNDMWNYIRLVSKKEPLKQPNFGHQQKKYYISQLELCVKIQYHFSGYRSVTTGGWVPSRPVVEVVRLVVTQAGQVIICLLYTSDAADE